MQRQKKSLSTWKTAAWATGLVFVSLLLLVVIVVVIEESEWELFPKILRVFWLAFLIILGFVFLSTYFIAKYHIKASIAILSIMAFVLLLASMKKSLISQHVSQRIYSELDVGLFIAAITLLAFVITLWEVYRTSPVVGPDELAQIRSELRSIRENTRRSRVYHKISKKVVRKTKRRVRRSGA